MRQGYYQAPPQGYRPPQQQVVVVKRRPKCSFCCIPIPLCC